jgi:hypothetical protein
MMAGMALKAGNRVAFALTVDYLNSSVDVVETSGAWLASDKNMNMSGIIIDVGICIRF